MDALLGVTFAFGLNVILVLAFCRAKYHWPIFAITRPTPLPVVTGL